MSYCTVCGDYGKDGGCPKCGRDSDKPIDLGTIKNVDRFISKCEYNLVPQEYIGIEWKREYLEAEHENLSKNINFKAFLDRLDKFHNSFKIGNPINKSVFIFSPPRFGKERLAFSCMQLAISKGLKVAPYLDTLDLKRLIVLGGENPKYKLYGRIDYDKYITADVLFVSVTHTRYLSEAYGILVELCTKRSRLGLPTYIISEYSIEELTSNTNEYIANKWKDVSSLNINELKYPVVIGFRPNNY